MGKILEYLQGYENIFYVPAPLAKVGLYLACAKHVSCEKSILLNEYIDIASPYTSAIINNISPLKAKIVQISSKAKTTQMLELGRVDYILFGDDTKTKMAGLQQNFQVVEIKTAYIYHILHKKHAELIPQLDAALKTVLAQQQQ